MKLSIDDISIMLGIPVNEVPYECRQIVEKNNLSYNILENEDRDQIILNILRILETNLSISGTSRLRDWEDGWEENYNRFVSSGYNLEELIPFYYRKEELQPLRLFHNFIIPEDPYFSLNILAIIRAWIGITFLKPFDHIYEIGCGPAHNLVAYSNMFPDKLFYGLDWSKSSQKIINAIHKSHGLNINGNHFEMFSPNDKINITSNSAVLTIGSMEQLGRKHGRFMQYLLDKSPGICIHLEPMYELYDQDNLFDYLAARYNEMRGYLVGYYPRLQELEKIGEIEILIVKKHIGNLYNDGWTTVAWKPKI